MTKIRHTETIFAWLFLTTGVFAIVGSLYTWGDGPLFSEVDLVDFQLPMADLLLTGPLSIIASIGIWKQKKWGRALGLMAGGIFVFGSIEVYIGLIWNGPPFPPELIIPPLFGIGIAVAFLIYTLKTPNLTLNP